MLDPFIRSSSLVPRGGPGLACDDDGLTLGPTVLAKVVRDAARHGRYRLRAPEDIAQALRLAYGPIPDRVVERWCRGLARVAELLACGENAHARIYAVLLGFPEIAPDGMAKLARAAELAKDATWENEPRVPAGNRSGGEWTSDQGGVEIAAAGDLPCQGCASGGSYGTTGMYRIGGKILCHDCAVKATGLKTSQPR